MINREHHERFIKFVGRIGEQDVWGLLRLQRRLGSPNRTTAYVNAERLINGLADYQDSGWQLQLVRNIRKITLFGWRIQISKQKDIKSYTLPTDKL